MSLLILSRRYELWVEKKTQLLGPTHGSWMDGCGVGGRLDGFVGGGFFFFFLIAERNVCFRVVTENAANIRVIPNDQHGPDNG